MLRLIGATLLEQIRIMWPIFFWIVGFAIWNLVLRYIVEIFTDRKWLKNPKMMNEIAREHIRQRDEIIHRQQKEIARLKYHNENMWVAIREALNALQNIHKSGNEKVYKKKEAS